MEKTNKNIILTFYLLISLIVAITATATYWWKISESHSGLYAEYWLQQKVICGNSTIRMETPIFNITASSDLAQSLSSSLTTNFNIAIAAAAFNIVAFTSYILSYFKRKKIMGMIVKCSALISAILFLAAIIFFALEIHPKIANLESILPLTICQITGKTVAARFWGEAIITTASLTQHWFWGPGTGWFSALNAFILNLYTPFLVKDF